MRLLAVAAGCLVLAGCGSQAPRAVSDGPWRTVLRDAADGRLDTNWSCRALRAALPHFPSSTPRRSPVPDLLAAAEAKACDAVEGELRPGQTRPALHSLLGGPNLAGPRCTLWKWTPASGAIDGVTVCFRRGRAITVITAVHG